jgi:hemolysin activation/secretion protein
MNILRSAFLALLLTSFSSLHSVPIICSSDLRESLEKLLHDHSDLSAKDAAKHIESYLRQGGYPFAQAQVVELDGRKVISVKEGKIGNASVSGNKHLSTRGIIKNLNWNPGDPFNYGKFQRQAAQLNRNRFVVVDTKLSPKRADDGEVIVDADFKVNDSVPISGNLDISNNGTPQSSGWRSKVGVEMWEPFSSSDRISFTYSTDPKETSAMQSYSFAYQANYGSFSHALFGGYSESEYSNQVSQSDLFLSDGMYLGFLGSYGFESGSLDGMSLTYGLTYLKSTSQIMLSGFAFPEAKIPLYLPRIGLQGSFKNPWGDGKSFWSGSFTSDLSTSDNTELAQQRPGVEKGFLITNLSFSTFEPVDIGSVSGGISLKINAQATADPLPPALQKSLGGQSAIRGYEENEGLGDRAVLLNLEYRFDAQPGSLFGLEGNFQKLAFYDFGYSKFVSLPGATTDSSNLQSFGAGIAGSLGSSTDFTLQVGVPTDDGPDGTEKLQPRAHFGLNIRF